MILPITLTIAAAAAFTHIWLASRCIRSRFQHGVSIGDGDNVTLRTRMRAHANFSENAPIFLILLGLVELGGGNATLLWIAGIGFILARIAHAFGMERPAPNALRAVGMLLTLILLVAMAVYAITLSYATPQPTMIG